MAFLDLMRRFVNASHEDEEPGIIAEALELRDKLAEDPNDVVSFDELADLIKGFAVSEEPADPLTGDSSEADPELVLWALSEEIGSDSRAWYPLIQLARLSGPEDPEAAQRYLETAADREETGIALAEGIKLLRETGQNEAAIQLGLGRWKPAEQVLGVAEELVSAALAANKIDEARSYVRILKESGQVGELVDDLEIAIATRKAKNGDVR
ncbi:MULTISPECIES: hypothetical protein [Trueperella]|uniref:Tetratricopeptide repeat protein n=1 Tax=Trueperella bernardiae TaxID=59561 RepID=A0A0W1KMM0_9ACTO|nr:MULTISPECIES: hypothetical protein [Trueperella]KTF04857.1 hypothetical protein AQZ59_00159 [Trueperella bernardiae]MCM3907230.1 hypothetical protein [Trueperella bernardiae]MDK8601199.1 hypothetical protein [Trueperella bernardiae]MDV6239383.1 hypothetical protein [Trueperella bernardiae]OFS75697.1 hypothetical protein HMPREF3167_02440 [Trueperella sp. HMSC08B05]